MMKIDRITPAQGISAYEPVRRAYSPQKPRDMGNDRAEFSAGALSFAATLKALKNSMAASAQDTERVKGIEERVNADAYDVDTRLVADKMLNGLKLDRNA